MGLIVVLTLARGLHFVAVSVLCGASLFQLYAPRAARSASALSKSALQGWVLLLVVSGVAWAGGLVAAITGDLANLISADVLRGFFLETGFGRVWLFRFVLMLLVALVVVTAPHASKASADASHKPSRRMHFVLYLSTAALLISQAWIGHSFASAVAGDWIAIVVYAAHVLSAAVWIGGLWPLAQVLRAPSLAIEQRFAALQSFSTVALLSVIVLVGSGMANSFYRLGLTSGSLSTTYCFVIVVKIGLLGAALMLASDNRYSETPKLLKPDLEARAMATLLRNILREQWLCAAILMAAAVLGLLSPMAA